MEYPLLFEQCGQFPAVAAAEKRKGELTAVDVENHKVHAEDAIERSGDDLDELHPVESDGLLPKEENTGTQRDLGGGRHAPQPSEKQRQADKARKHRRSGKYADDAPHDARPCIEKAAGSKRQPCPDKTDADLQKLQCADVGTVFLQSNLLLSMEHYYYSTG